MTGVEKCLVVQILVLPCSEIRTQILVTTQTGRKLMASIIVQKSGRADSWTASSSDIFADDWEIVMEE